MTETRPAHRPSSREAMLDAAAAYLGEQGTISLETAARAAGVTKAGLMYHFGTKAELLTAVLDRVLDQQLDDLRRRVDDPESVTDRIAAYVDWACGTEFGTCDLVMFTDPRLREEMTERWVARLEPWLAVPDRLPAADRHRLLSARLMADGVWFAGASGTLTLTSAQLRGVRQVAHELLAETR